MIRFIDGPAQGCQGFCLQRAPLYLRVVQSAEGEWDALDQPGDSPREGETVHAYLRVGPAGSVHVQRSGPGGRGRQCSWYATGEYVLVAPQPDQDVLRDTTAWQEWATAQVVQRASQQ